MCGMEIHTPATLRTLHLRLLSNGRAMPASGEDFPLPATWEVKRRWRHGGAEHCFVVATIDRRPYFANVPAATLADLDTSDGMLLRVERFSRQ